VLLDYLSERLFARSLRLTIVNIREKVEVEGLFVDAIANSGAVVMLLEIGQ